MRRRALAAAGIAAVTAAVFAGTVGNGFLNLDDPAYVTANPLVREGLTLRGAASALVTFRASNWHPLTWLSHMADVSLFGLSPAGHHATSLALHAVNAALCFLVLAAMTGAPWRSGAAALLFALHPLRVESVAWIAERKDLLAGLLFLLAIGAWHRYAKRPSPARYATVALLLAVGLAAKPMLVTLPFVLLLLDWWPLGRIARVGVPAPAAGVAPVPVARALLEKAPLLLLSAASCAVTLAAQSAGGSLADTASRPLPLRAANALWSLVAYLGATAWPADLAVFYPYPVAGIPAWRIAAAVLALGLVTAAAVRLRRTFPPLAVGWLWFAGMLVPVIGFVQAGDQAMADRYTYLPSIGLAVAAVWGAARMAGRRPALRIGTAVAAGLLLAAFAAASIRQVAVWKDDLSLWRHALAVTTGNVMAHHNLGVAYAALGAADEAEAEYRRALAINPSLPEARLNLGNRLFAKGLLAGAQAEYAAALAARPGFPEAHAALGTLLLATGSPAPAAGHLRQALAARPDLVEAMLPLGLAAERLGDRAEAERWLSAAAAATPGDPAPVEALVRVLAAAGDHTRALPWCRRLAALSPGSARAHAALGRALYWTGDRAGARAAFGQALRLDPADPTALQGMAILGKHGG